MFGPQNHPNHPRGRRHYGGPFEDFAAGPFGGPFAGPTGRGRGGRRRMRRGDTRAAILVLLAEQPANGYRLMQEVAERSDGAWRPSPGSIYPALQQLEDEGLIAADAEHGKKSFALTADGESYVKENREKLGEPWAGLQPEINESTKNFWLEVKPLLEAAKQVGSVGDEAAQQRGQAVLAEARRKLYAILAEDNSSA